MKISCMMGFHDWAKDCEECSRCGATRQKAHQWTDCKCSACGKGRDHDWARDCEKCSRCGAIREAAHPWSGCTCSACGKTREHDWAKNCERCSRCGAARQAAHRWSGCTCSMCGKTREHDWAKDCQKCSRCAATRDVAHRWTGCQCLVCGKTRDQDHAWGSDCEKCSVCGASRQGAHKWDGCKCPACGKLRDEGHDWCKDGDKCVRCGQIRGWQLSGTGSHPVYSLSLIPSDYVDVVSHICTAMAAVNLTGDSEKTFADAWICGEEIMRAESLADCIARAPYSSRFNNWPAALAAVGATRLAQIVRQIIAVISGGQDKTITFRGLNGQVISVVSEGHDLYGPQTVLANLRVPENGHALRNLHAEFRSLAGIGAPEDLAALLYRYADKHPEDFNRFRD